MPSSFSDAPFLFSLARMMENPRVMHYLKQAMGVRLPCMEARGNRITVEVRMAPAG